GDEGRGSRCAVAGIEIGTLNVFFSVPGATAFGSTANDSLLSKHTSTVVTADRSAVGTVTVKLVPTFHWSRAIGTVVAGVVAIGQAAEQTAARPSSPGATHVTRSRRRPFMVSSLRC